jgi:hypothetical protein
MAYNSAPVSFFFAAFLGACLSDCATFSYCVAVSALVSAAPTRGMDATYMAPATTASPTPARSRGFDELMRFIVFLSLFVRALLAQGRENRPVRYVTVTWLIV